jgi:hypothetical protein
MPTSCLTGSFDTQPSCAKKLAYPAGILPAKLRDAKSTSAGNLAVVGVFSQSIRMVRKGVAGTVRCPPSQDLKS